MAKWDPRKTQLMSMRTSLTDDPTARSESRVLEIEQIDTALSKIKTGTYGTCETCDLELDDVRLDILPFAPLCTRCAKMADM